MDFLLPENGHVDPDDGDYQSKDLVADRMVQHEPLLICNYELDVLNNERQFDRIFSDHQFENVLDPRYCNVGICTQDLRKEKFCSKKVEQAPDFTNDVVPNVNNGSVGAGAGNLAPFTTGKGDPRFYFKAIDTESRLQRIGYADNLCYVKDFRSQDVPEGGDKEVFDKDAEDIAAREFFEETNGSCKYFIHDVLPRKSYDDIATSLRKNQFLFKILFPTWGVTAKKTQLTVSINC